MFKGGPIYTRVGAMVFSLAELILPFFLLIYGILLQDGAIPSTHIVDAPILFIMMPMWIVLGLLQLFAPPTSINGWNGATVRDITYHILAGLYLVFVTGLSSPLVGCWCIFFIAAYAIRNRAGIAYSSAIFIFFVLFDTFFWSRNTPGIIVNNFLIMIVILSVCLTTASIFQTQKTSQEKLDLSKAREFLQRNRILTIVNNLTDAVLSLDTQGIVRVYNAASLNLLDTNESLNGKHIDDILPLIDQAHESVSLFKELQNSKITKKRDDLNFKYDDGEEIRLEITYTRIRKTYSQEHKGNAQDGYVVILRDVTKAKSLEEERNEFISVVSHELRTPITIAEGSLSNVQLMMKHPDITQKMLGDAVDTAHDQVIFLANMVNDLSTLSRAERDVDGTAEDIDAQELAHKMHDKYAAAAKAKGLHLDLDLSPKLGTVHVSRLYIEELLQNFLTNAIKYTKKGSITIVFNKKGNEISFAVKDTGIGISKTDQPKVFDKFYRSEDFRTRETSGTGLGLYISAKLAHKIGTKIISTSRLNFGSTFSFSLPIKKDAVDSKTK